MLTTARLCLRKWEESDAENLFEYAKSPDVGPSAGWLPHKSIEESREIIKTVLNGREAYAVCLKEDNKSIGAIELMYGCRFAESENECELGYWLAKPFWGQGLIPEAGERMLRRAFEELGMCKVWCAYYQGNEKSERVQEKLGFKYVKTVENFDVPMLKETRTLIVNCITKEEWENMITVEVKYILKPGQRDNFYNSILYF